VLNSSPPRHFLNAYGPTECTTFTTTYQIESVTDDAKSVPIGSPISNVQVYILDDHLRPVPIGAAGEIYIGGEGVALGYLNRPELTAGRFIADPFSAIGGARLYKSGDLARWRADGTIDFQSRNDHQVKLRGFRIELGEIEAQLARYSRVKEAVAVAREDVPGDKHLVAYVTGRGESNPAAAELRAHMEAALPEYMVPRAFVVLESLPLTSTGKVDRRALPMPGIDAYASKQYEAPQGEVEEMLARIWQELLVVDRVGRQDNFFSLGGHSLLGLKALFKINQSFGCALTIRDVYKCPSPSSP
jgi:acyl-CoA synthetase (AMP-forming)/AMP-acid ligase II